MWKRLDKVITKNQQKYVIRALQSMSFFHWHLKVSDSNYANLCNALISGNYFVHQNTNNFKTVRFIDFIQTRMAYRDLL